MKTQYSDPNHPMYNGGLIGLASGGRLSGGRRSMGDGRNSFSANQSGSAPTYGLGRPGMWDSSRLYSDDGMFRRDDYRFNKRARRAVRTEQRLLEGRHVGRKRERRYERFVEGQQRYGPSYGQGPIGMLLQAATSAGRGRDGDAQLACDRQEGPFNPRGGADHAEYAHYGRPSPIGGRGMARGYAGRRAQRGRGGGPIGMVKRVMREDVLYLMIVNMPSEAELAEAREAIEAAKKK